MATPYREKIAKRSRRPTLLPLLLPLPLVVTLLYALSHNRLFFFVVSFICAALYLLSAYFLSRANFYEAQAHSRKWARPSRTPWRISAAIFSALATGILAYFIVDHGLFVSLGYGFTALLGMILYHGLDPTYEASGTGLIGVTSEELTDAFNEAEIKIKSIRDSSIEIKSSDAALASRLDHIADGAQHILDIIADDPNDLRRARKFLKVYLGGTQKVVSQYVGKKHTQENEKIESNLRQVLDTIDDVIEEQRIKLLENDVLELDVQIEVLQTQLKNEGIS